MRILGRRRGLGKGCVWEGKGVSGGGGRWYCEYFSILNFFTVSWGGGGSMTDSDRGNPVTESRYTAHQSPADRHFKITNIVVQGLKRFPRYMKLLSFS